MKNRWIESEADQCLADENVGLRVYSSQLLGMDSDLVLHGGGNTSVKGELENVFGDRESVLFVKGSGWDLRTIESAGFPPVKMDYLSKLGELDHLSDSEMMRQLRLGLLDPTAPTPSVEAILHALIPHKYVDHSHADAVVAISNTANGEAILREIYGKQVLILPYVMPGFILAQQVAAATRDLDWSSVRGIILLHHGIFSFDNDAKASYDSMIEMVSQAEAYLDQQVLENKFQCNSETYQPSAQDCLQLSELRARAGDLYGGPVLLRLDSSSQAFGFSKLDNCHDLASRGPLTPDHTIHTKAFAAIFEQDPVSGLQQFERDYQQYFTDHSSDAHQCLDPMPRYGVWRNKGMVYLAANRKKLQIVQDISQHTVKAIQLGEILGGWQALPRKELFDVEYWELEQAKLKSAKAVAEFEGKVVLISGAASGIGRACVEKFAEKGAVVIALDIASGFEATFDSPAILSLHCDVTDSAAVELALQQAIVQFGGIDVLVSNAGNFPESQKLESLQDSNWNKSLELNLSSHMKLMRASLPYLKNGFDPAIVIIASKNVPAPGPGAAAYSVAKAGLTQMARVAALELGENGIRVNALHPNAVYDTAIWTDEVLAKRAEHYQLSVDQYKTANVLKTEIKAADVAKAVCVFAGNSLSKTTGAQLAVDGGNERVI
ncbi:MAG: bifunctional aldolase/short-chain dehydrogenase [SAR86 cluster bacterium]|uniref:Bifunctional aldolase/short-chain dehydrogenase n=1 Tax=SAR86 cluster bacterium TaxID=2030880 RepID=A0A2A5AWU1_9GAMM|nr:MAG: bifunctional aldolase/short-chain dehydrogenase [SAR86 cluster bacterium]